MVWNRVLETEPTEPPVSQINFNFLTQPTFRADRIAVADQQHPDHQFWIDRRTTRMAAKWLKLGTQPGQVKHCVEPT